MTTRCRFPLWLAALLTLLLPAVAPATTVIAPDFNRLVNTADYVVRATVKSVASDWRPDPGNPGKSYIGTRVELEVHEVIKGNPPSPLVLDLVGGSVGGQTLRIEGSPRFATGQQSILFVRGNGRQVVPLVGMRHGHYPLRRDPATGRDLVMRSGGRYLYNEAEVSLPESMDSVLQRRDPRAQPLTAAEFAARIRGVIQRPEQTRERHD